MRTSSVGLYALRLSFGQASQVSSQSSANAFATSPDRVVTRSATMLALFGIALSSFSLKQMLANSGEKSAAMTAIPMRKF